jgi:hypothetical protein
MFSSSETMQYSFVKAHEDIKTLTFPRTFRWIQHSLMMLKELDIVFRYDGPNLYNVIIKIVCKSLSILHGLVALLAILAY